MISNQENEEDKRHMVFVMGFLSLLLSPFCTQQVFSHLLFLAGFGNVVHRKKAVDIFPHAPTASR